MKFFNKIKEFISNVASGDYDHATQSMNQFIATGKFPDKCELKKPELVEAEVVDIPDQVMRTSRDDLTKKKAEALEELAVEKNLKIKRK